MPCLQCSSSSSNNTHVCIHHLRLTRPPCPVSLCVCRSVPPHRLRRLPHAARHPLRGCPLPAPPAGCPQTSSGRRAQRPARSGLLPSSPAPVHEHEHELHGLLPQVSASSRLYILVVCSVYNVLAALSFPSMLLLRTSASQIKFLNLESAANMSSRRPPPPQPPFFLNSLHMYHTAAVSLSLPPSLQPPGLSIHSGLLCSSTRSHGGGGGGPVSPRSGGGGRSSGGGGGLPRAAPARRPGPDAGPPLQHRGQGHPQLLPGIPGQYASARTQPGWTTVRSVHRRAPPPQCHPLERQLSTGVVGFVGRF